MGKESVTSLCIDPDNIIKMRDADEPKEFLGRYGGKASQQVRVDLRTLDALLQAGEYEIAKRFSEDELDTLAGILRKMKGEPDSLADKPYALIRELSFMVETSGKKGAKKLSAKVDGMGPVEACALLHMARVGKKKRKRQEGT